MLWQRTSISFCNIFNTNTIKAMNLKEKIAAMRTVLATFTATMKFADYKLEDGTTIIRIDGEPDPAMKPAVSVIAEDGSILPAPAGEHIVPDLGTIVVENGQLVAITPAAAPVVEEALADPTQAATAVEEVAAVVETLAPEAAPEEAAAIATDVVAEIQEKILAMEGVIEEMKKKVDAMGAASSAQAASFSATLNAMAEALAEAPSAPATKTGFSAVIENTKKKEADNFGALANVIKTFKP